MVRIPPGSHHFERRIDGIEYGVLDDLIGYALRRAQIAIYEDFEQALGPLDITPQRFSALVVIARNKGMTQSELGRVLGIARSGVVQLIHALEQRGWVARETHGTDSRAWRLVLTASGRDRLTDARRRVRAHDRRVSERLDATERSQLVALLNRLG